MRSTNFALCALLLLPALCAQEEPKKDEMPSIEKAAEGRLRREGFLSFQWDEKTGKLWLEVDPVAGEMIYQTSLASGLGSNPVGLDRGKLGSTRLVRFERVANKLLLVQPNLDYRALTDNAAERRAVGESFAQSIVWGAEIAAESDGRVLVDATPLLMRDACSVIATLKRTKQGGFKVDASRSAVHPAHCRAFPRNTELEARLTFTGEAPGPEVRATAPMPQAVTLRQRHSFIALPEPGYRPRVYDPRSGSFSISFADYATPLDQPLVKRWVVRHRLVKKNPGPKPSPVVEPIVYYVDAGAPARVRDALVEGASWWARAFEAAGFLEAFRVEVMPEDADPLDVRYNVIQWVHRATRGWSYGSSVVDPRTGEILKGHVTLGSLRARQDRTLFEGLTPRFAHAGQCCGQSSGPDAAAIAAVDPALDAVGLSLARLRQLSAHEVGHTLGFRHNFAASTNDRASVMDYPAPRVSVDAQGELDFSDAYAVGIGSWDVVSVRWAYGDFGETEAKALASFLDSVPATGHVNLSDADARSVGSAHPLASLWDDGSDPVAGLKRAMDVRVAALARFGERSLPRRAPVATLEERLVPLYLHHRYQVDAAAKLVGGRWYRYAVRGDGGEPPRVVEPERQREALRALLDTLDVDFLRVPERIVKLIPPRPPGFGGSRELFARTAGRGFDPAAAVRAAADVTVAALLHPQRAERLLRQHEDHGPGMPGLDSVVRGLMAVSWDASSPLDGPGRRIRRAVRTSVLDGLIDLADDPRASFGVRALVVARLRELRATLLAPRGVSAAPERERAYAAHRIDRFLSRPESPVKPPRRLETPPGSPIGDH